MSQLDTPRSHGKCPNPCRRIDPFKIIKSISPLLLYMMHPPIAPQGLAISLSFKDWQFSLINQKHRSIMQQVIPYKSCLPQYDDGNNNRKSPIEHSPRLSHKKSVVAGGHLEGQLPKGYSGNTTNMVSENAVIVFATRGCCMGHVVKRLLLVLGVNPPVYEIDEENESSVLQELERIINTSDGTDGGNDTKLQFPAVFVGGRLFGGLDRLMATHISGELVPILKEAGALWL